MKHLYFLLGCMLSASQIASAQALEERDVEFPSRWVNAQGEVLIQDSIQGVKSNGNLTAVEYNHFNAEGYETASEVVTFKWDGTRSNSAKDEFTYNENNELVKYDLYSWTTEWEKNTISEYYYSNSRLDSTYVSKFDSDLAEWFVNGIEVSKYDETTGALTSFTYYKRDGVYNDLRKDLMFEYSEFNQFNKPAKGQSFIGDNGEWAKYMDIAFEYDGNGNMTSIIYTRTDSEGVTSNILKTERAYNDSGQITEIVTYRNDTSTGGWAYSSKEERTYDETDHYLTGIATFRYYSDKWNAGNKTVYYWSPLATTGIDAVTGSNNTTMGYANGRISVMSNSQVKETRIFNMAGTMVARAAMQSNGNAQYTANIGRLKAGIYLMQTECGGKIITKKICVYE